MSHTPWTNVLVKGMNRLSLENFRCIFKGIDKNTQMVNRHEIIFNDI